jgi:hypothetical protein
VHADYLQDLGVLLREMAMEAKARQRETGTDFATGYMSGFHRVISLMQQQAEAFGIPLADIGLDGIDPDEELV